MPFQSTFQDPMRRCIRTEMCRCCRDMSRFSDEFVECTEAVTNNADKGTGKSDLPGLVWMQNHVETEFQCSR